MEMQEEELSQMTPSPLSSSPLIAQLPADLTTRVFLTAKPAGTHTHTHHSLCLCVSISHDDSSPVPTVAILHRVRDNDTETQRMGEEKKRGKR